MKILKIGHRSVQYLFFFSELKEYFKVTGLQSLDEAETQAVTLGQGLTQNSSKTETQFAEMLRLKWRFSRALLS